MTMVPAQNLSKQQYLLLHQYHSRKASTANYGGGFGGNIDDLYTTERFGGNSVIMSRKSTQGYDYCSATDQSSCGGSDILVVGDHHHHQYPLLMADDQQDESRTNSLNNDAASTNSNKESIEGTADQDHQEIRGRDDDDHEGWLKLSIGGHCTGLRHQNTTTHHHHHHHHHDVIESTAAARRGIGGAVTGLNTIELDLLPGGGSGGGIRSMSAAMLEGPGISTTHHHQIGRGSSTMSNFGSGTNFSTTSLMYFQQYYPGSSSTSTSNFPHHHQEALNNWAFRPLIPQQYYHAASSTTTSSLLMPVLQPQLGSATTTSYLARQFQPHQPVVDAAVAATAGPIVDFRVVNPPQRPHSGIWFMLQALQNQAKEPFLPQISKSFLRIKDGRMTVRLLIKYLVNKLRLDSESEIEITCRGQQLLPYLTLQHVRDNIWAPTLTLLPDSSSSSSSTTDHIMVLHYSRSSA